MAEEYISRRDAISWFRAFARMGEDNIPTETVLDDLAFTIPAADVEPVRHGNWNIRLADELTLCLECSVCGRQVYNIDLHHLLEAGEYGEACRRYPYCHCGAKMQGGENE